MQPNTRDPIERIADALERQASASERQADTLATMDTRLAAFVDLFGQAFSLDRMLSLAAMPWALAAYDCEDDHGPDARVADAEANAKIVKDVFAGVNRYLRWVS